MFFPRAELLGELHRDVDRAAARASAGENSLLAGQASRHALKHCWSSTWRTSSSTEKSMALHSMSSPMPSTL